MTDEPIETTERWTVPDDDGVQGAAASAAGAAAGSTAPGSAVLPNDRPEVLIGGAFAGGFLAAMILKRLGRR